MATKSTWYVGEVGREKIDKKQRKLSAEESGYSQKVTFKGVEAEIGIGKEVIEVMKNMKREVSQ